MRFRSMLTHRCTLLLDGGVIGEDDYGRDIIGKIESMNVPCKLDEPKYTMSVDDNGTDYLLNSLLFLPPEFNVDLNTTILNIVDKKGNPVVQGSFSVKGIVPISDLKKLHHYELTIRRE